MMFEFILPQLAFNSLLPTLAADWVGIAVFVVAVLLTVGGWVMNAYKKFQESAELRRQQQQASMRAARGEMRIDGRADDDDLEEIKPAGAMTSKERLDALAARRRAQMAQVRAQSGRPAATSQPDNLSAAQRAARDRAKQAYERRAELLARQRQAQQQAAQQNAQRQQASQQAKAQSTQARAAGQQSRAQPQQVSPQQQTATRQANAQALAAANRSRAMAESAREMAESAVAKTRRIKRGGQLEVEEIKGRSTINDESLEIVKTRQQQNAIGAGKLRQALTGQSIRAAFVLKEVLDRPIALRQPEDKPGTLNFKD